MTNKATFFIGLITTTVIDTNKISDEAYTGAMVKAFGQNTPLSACSNKLALGSLSSLKKSLEMMKIERAKKPTLTSVGGIVVMKADIATELPIPKELLSVVALYNFAAYEAPNAMTNRSLLISESTNLNNCVISFAKDRHLLGTAPRQMFKSIIKPYGDFNFHALFGGKNKVMYVTPTASEDEVLAECVKEAEQLFAELVARYKSNIEVAYLDF